MPSLVGLELPHSISANANALFRSTCGARANNATVCLLWWQFATPILAKSRPKTQVNSKSPRILLTDDLTDDAQS